MMNEKKYPFSKKKILATILAISIVEPYLPFANNLGPRNVYAAEIQTAVGALETDDLKIEPVSVNASSEAGSEPAQNAIDGKASTIWSSAWNVKQTLPGYLTLDLGNEYTINKVIAMPRATQDNGKITKYAIEVSSDNNKFTEVKSGEWDKTVTEKIVTFNAVKARYVRLKVIEAVPDPNGTQSISLAEFNVFKESGTVTPPNTIPDDINQKSTAVSDIQSSSLKVTVDEKFPSINKYTLISNGKTLDGQEDQISKVLINGMEYVPEVSFSKTADTAKYVLNIPSINISIVTEIKVVNNDVEFNVTDIEEKGDIKVSTFEIPNHNIVSVKSTEAGAALAGAIMYNKVNGSGDTFMSLEGSPKIDAKPVGYMYAFINNKDLSAGIWTNSIYDKPTGERAKERFRIQKQTVNKGKFSRTGLWSGAWTYRATDATATEPLPSEKISITADANSDGNVDWQDGAIAFRDIMNNPQGAERVPELVVQRISMNFGSQATNPFLKTLDETKKVYLATDGLGQATILKGYGSEGHDSAHPDYGDIGIRQGGATDMNTLIESGAKYNADFGVHINATESYPEAKAFNETLIDKKSAGWDWLDPSYGIKTHFDGTSDNRLKRLKELKAQVPDLKYIYLDVWYGDGWENRKIAREINSQGWRLATEFPNTLEYDTTFSHWATDYKYGGLDMKGFNSKIVRFIRNQQKDTWIARNPLLGGTELTDYEGWQGRVDFNSMINMTFGTNLPTKYLQNFLIMKWTDNTINLDGNVMVSNSNATKTRIITKDGITILNGDSYLLPWNPKTEAKLYHWNDKGGESTWTLPLSWKDLSTVKLYKLTDEGRQLVGNLPVTNNKIKITADAKTPYVVDKEDAAPVEDVNWGEGSLIKDPGFESGSLKDWKVTGTGAEIKRNARGQYELKLSGNDATTVSQTITGLSKGTYSAIVNVEVAGTRKAILGVKDFGGKEVTSYADSSFAKNYIAADSKHGTNMQRMRVFFDVPEGETKATIYLKAEEGSVVVTFDDVRVVEVIKSANPTNAYFTQDFEHSEEGLYPFVKGQAGGSNDPRTHLAELHDPYTQKGWNGHAIDDVIDGKWSLKAHKEDVGLLLQTIPQNLRFIPGRNYRVSFKYENQGEKAYGFAIGDGAKKVYSKSFETVTEPQTYSIEFTALPSGNLWIGIDKLSSSQTDFVLDDLLVEDIGVGDNIPIVSPNVNPAVIPQDKMTATATSEESGYEPASNVLDGDSSTTWSTAWSTTDETKLPQSLSVDLGGKYTINKVTALPRQDGNVNGRITKYELWVSNNNGKDYTKVSEGKWDKTNSVKEVSFLSIEATNIKLIALEGGNGWAGLSEINVLKDLSRLDFTKAVKEALDSIHATNNTNENDIISSVKTSVQATTSSAVGISIDNYNVKKATDTSNGEITGTVVIQCEGDKSKYNLKLIILSDKIDIDTPKGKWDFTKAVNKGVDSIHATNKTTEDDILSSIETSVKATTSSAVEISIDNYNVKKATDTSNGEITGTVVIQCEGDKSKYNLKLIILSDKMDTDTPKGKWDFTKAVNKGVDSIHATNKTTEDDILSSIETFVKATTSSAVEISINNYNVKKATDTSNGEITGTVVIQCDGNSSEYSLKLIILSDEIDKSKLKDLYNSNKDKKQGKYTTESWELFKIALDKGQIVLNKTDAIQIEVNNAVSDLKKAVDGLKITSSSSKKKKKKASSNSSFDTSSAVTGTQNNPQESKLPKEVVEEVKTKVMTSISENLGTGTVVGETKQIISVNDAKISVTSISKDGKYTGSVITTEKASATTTIPISKDAGEIKAVYKYVPLLEKYIQLTEDVTIGTDAIKLPTQESTVYYAATVPMASTETIAQGWVKTPDNNWYMVNETGDAKTGWQKDSTGWVYLSESNGSMQTGWNKQGNAWYYLGSNGYMTIGWMKINDKWYYLNADGSMAHDTEIDGYTLDSSGQWV